MKKTLRSIFTLCLSLVFVITLCPCFSVMAATDLSTLTAEALAVSATAGNQSPNNIVADLTLPTEGITWSSSTTGIISNEGKVTRPVFEDANVTLTASDGETTKAFAFIVKAKKTNIIAQESFYYTGLENVDHDTDVLASLNGSWRDTTGTKRTHIKTDASGNKYAELGLNANAQSYLYWDQTAEANKINLDFGLTLTAQADTDLGSTLSGTSYVLAVVRGTNSNNEEVAAVVRLMTISADRWLYWGDSANQKYIRLNASKMLPVSITLDLDNMQLTGSLIGGTGASYTGDECTVDLVGYSQNDKTTVTTEGNTFTRLTSIRLLATSAFPNYVIDNLVLSTEGTLTAEDIFSVATAEKLAVNASVGNQIPTSIVADLTLPEAEGLTWTSSNPDVISNEGVVTRPMLSDTAVTLTASYGETTEEFDFVVKAKKTNVIAQESFCYDGLENTNENTDIFAFMNDWANTAATKTTASHIHADVNGNKYAELGLDATGSNYFQWNKPVTANKAKLDFDVMMNTASDVSGTTYITALLSGTNTNGEEVKAQVYLSVISADKWLYWGKANNNGDAAKLDATKMLPLSIEFDLENKTLASSLIGSPRAEYDGDVYVDNMVGYQATDVAALADEGNTFTTISWIRIFSNGSPNLDVDNFMISTEGFPILSTHCDASGKVSATLGNSSGQEQVAKVICAGYNGEKLIEVESLPITLASGNNNVEFTKSFSNATSYTIYLWSDMGKLIPLCKSASASLSE